jgi:hypothetical protein
MGLDDMFFGGTISVRFKSRGVEYNSIEFIDSNTKYIKYEDTVVYNGDEEMAKFGWTVHGYKYIEILSEINEVSDSVTFLELLKNHGTKIEDPIYDKKFTFVNRFSTTSISDSTTSIIFPFLYATSNNALFNLKSAYRFKTSGGGCGVDNNTFRIHIGAGSTSSAYIYYESDSNSEKAYTHGWMSDKASWTNDYMRSIYVKCKITDVAQGYLIYRMLQENATEYTCQKELFDFTIDGNVYQATTIMNFQEWCASPYNTIGATCVNFSDAVSINGKILENIYGYTAVEKKSYIVVEDTGGA